MDEPDTDTKQWFAMLKADRKAYRGYSLDEKQVYWENCFVDLLFKRLPGDWPIDVKYFKTIEPDFDLFIEGIADHLANITGEDRNDILEGCFIRNDQAE